MELGIPFDCLAEGQPVYHQATGASYTVVKPESALVEGAQNYHILENKNHNEMQKVASSKED